MLPLQLYEVVVFSNGYSMSVEPWLERLDPIMLTAQVLATDAIHASCTQA